MRAGRGLQLALALVLIGSVLVLWGAGRPWVQLVLAQPAPLPPRTDLRLGTELSRSLRPLAVLGPAGVAALAATRGRGRRLLGSVLLVAGVAVGASTVSVLARGAGASLRGSTGTAWPYVVLLGSALLAVGGLVVAVFGPRWAAMSARYAAPAARAAPGIAGSGESVVRTAPAAAPATAPAGLVAWEALDRGEDPTVTAAPAEGDGDPRQPAHPTQS